MRHLTAVVIAAVLLASPHVHGQSSQPAPSSAATTGFMHAIHATDNVETTLAFYRDVFGLDAKVQPFANPAVPILTNSPGVTLRVAMLRIPGRGFNFELTEFSNTERRPAQPALTDPGAPHMRFMVKDVAAVIDAARKRGTPFITTGSTPSAGGVFMRDPDGYIVSAQQTEAPAGATGNVVGAVMGLTVRDIDESQKFWRDLLGWQVDGWGSFSRTPDVAALMGLPDGVQVSSARATVPGSAVQMEMFAFRGASGTPFDRRVPDPGASGMAIRVAAIQDLLPRLKAAGVRVVSKDGALVEWDAKTRNVFVKDPNGLLIELVGTVAAPK